MNKDTINSLLDALDGSINSNTFWLELEMPEDENQIAKVLQRHLEYGTFHHALVIQDIERGWNQFSDVVYSSLSKSPIVIPRPGNSYNREGALEIHLLSRLEMIDLLHELLTGIGSNFTKSDLGDRLSEANSRALIDSIIQMLDRADTEWQVFRIKATFLYQVNDKFDTSFAKPAYFEGKGRDSAFCFQIGNSLQILLTNGFG